MLRRQYVSDVACEACLLHAVKENMSGVDAIIFSLMFYDTLLYC